VLAALGGKCQRCPANDPRVLQIDHVFGDGAEERRIMQGATFLRHVLSHLSSGRHQLLCPSCNILKRVTNFEDGRRFNLDAVYDLEAFFYSPTELPD
jgi:hypothetical protein